MNPKNNALHTVPGTSGNHQPMTSCAATKSTATVIAQL